MCVCVCGLSPSLLQELYLLISYIWTVENRRVSLVPFFGVDFAGHACTSEIRWRAEMSSSARL